MSTSQFFVYRRAVAWASLVSVLLWGGFAYMRLPQRQDPVIPVRSGVVLTAYPGARADRVEQEVTRKVERKLAENPAIETISSISRQGLSVVFVELYDSTRDAQRVWTQLRTKLREVPDLPRVEGRPLEPVLDEDFGDTVAVMLTLSSPPVPDAEIERRAAAIRQVVAAQRAGRAEDARADRVTGVLVYPGSVDAGRVRWIGESLLRHLAARGLARDGQYIEAPGAGCVDFQAAPQRDAELVEAVFAWQRDQIGTGLSHPDLWPGLLVRDLDTLADAIRAHALAPLEGLDRYTYRDLERCADLVRDRLKQAPTVGKVDRIGIQPEVVTLYYSDRRLAAYGLKPGDIARRIAAQNTNLPGGVVELPTQSVLIRPAGEFRQDAAIGGVVVAEQGGYPVYLRDLVTIDRGYADPPEPLHFRTLPIGQGPARVLRTQRAVTLAIRQVEGAQIADLSRDIDAAVEAMRPLLPPDLRIERTSDEPAEVRAKVAQFNQNLIEAVLIVIGVALLFMEWRSALLVAASIPLTVAMTMGICHLIGVDLQQVSIAALIIALGLLVDDPVVAGDAINRELAAGHPRDVAAWLGPHRLAHAILFATLTNCVAFLPLLLVTGETGEFIWSLPVVVTVSLVSSRIVSMTFIPLLGYHLLRGQSGFESALESGGRGARFARAYNGISEWCLRHRWASLGACVVLLVAGAACFPLLGTSFFPKDRHTVFTVNLTLAEGTPLRRTRDEAVRTLAQIDALAGPDAVSYTTFVGAGGPRFWLSVVPEQRTDNYAQILVHTPDAAATGRLVRTLKRALPPRVSAARVTVEELETGPPVGVPVQVRLSGPDAATLRGLAERIKDHLRQIPGSEAIQDDWGPEFLQLALDIDADRSNLVGITREDLAALLGGGLSGYEPTAIDEGDRRIPVRLRLRDDERTDLGRLGQLSVYAGESLARVPLEEIATFRPELTAPQIRRRDHERCLTVKCDAVPGVLPSRIVHQLDAVLKREAASWPPGYRYAFGGEREEQEEGFASVAVALAVSLAAIYLALVLQFNSVTKPLVVFAAVPFGVVGGLMGLLVFGAPFGFMAFLGVASLAGVIVSHIIVLFDYIEAMREAGEPLHRAVIDAALVRLRPVLVTVLATVGGLVPLALEGGPLWQPMCYVQIAGLLAATLVTKILVPVLYVIFVEDLGLIRWEAPGHAGHLPDLSEPPRPTLPRPEPARAAT